MRLTKRMENGSYAAINYQIVQKLGKYEDICSDPDLLRQIVFALCVEE